MHARSAEIHFPRLDAIISLHFHRSPITITFTPGREGVFSFGSARNKSWRGSFQFVTALQFLQHHFLLELSIAKVR